MTVGRVSVSSFGVLLAVMVWAALLAGCAAADRNGAPAQAPRGTPPDAVALFLNNFADTTGNRYRDSSSLNVYLFAEGHPIPITFDGEFTFVLESLEGDRIATWRFDAERTAAAVRPAGPGPSYHFDLSILRADDGIGTDEIAENEAVLIATFRPAGQGEDRELRRRSAPVQVGRIGRPRGL